MKGACSFLVIALVACSAGDDVADGTRGLCGEGGELNDCAGRPRTPQEACFRMVDCGAIPLHQEEEFRDDWDNCVGRIESMTVVAQELTIACIGAATCDLLRLDDDRCFAFGVEN